MPGPAPFHASYRLQLTPAFGFDQVVELFASLRRLGISHVYLSPISEAVTGSSHGYDVVDHRVVRAEFGGEPALRRLLDAAGDHDLGVVVEHVPNHVSVAHAELNPTWWALLRDGPGSPAADWFDVDWELTNGKVIVPKLGAPVEEIIASDGIDIATGPLGPELRVGSLRFPLAAGTEDLPVRDAVAAQHYELSWWRDPARNVRRFFTIDDLVAVCVEHDRVAEQVDTLPRRLCEHPAFAGVRVDHVDGLADPQRYLDGLQDLIGDRWLLVEKILGPGEQLPASWPVDGTTGYEHVTAAEHLLLDPAALGPLDTLWHEVADADDAMVATDFHAIERSARREVLDGGLAPDLERLVRAVVGEVGMAHDAAREAVIALTLELDRYRTYLPGDEPSVEILRTAERRAGERQPELAEAVGQVAAAVREHASVRVRWQQLTGPAMAKGAEDRAFYRHHRLSSLCEVGGQPGGWTLAVDAFHDHQTRVQAGWPTTMLTATTHDTKRSEAVRARSLALATMADDWADLVRSWWDDHPTVSVRRADVVHALQTVVTAWPLSVDRLHAFLVKAAREADLDTDWFDPDSDHESQLRALSAELVAEAAVAGSDLVSLVERVRVAGAQVGLRLLALQLTCPGVPDLYQGAPAELTSLVDPDNRRPPDWQRWHALVEAATSGWPADPDAGGDPDLARTRLVHRVLQLRRRHPDGFGSDAGYEPVSVSGVDAGRVIAFARLDPDRRTVATVVLVRPAADGLSGLAADVELPPGIWRNLVDGTTSPGRMTSVGSLVGETGVAVLAADD